MRPRIGRRSLLLVALTLCAAILSWRGSAQEARKPYTKDDIVNLLRGDVAPQRVAVLARERGIDFEITPEVESELRRAGATAALLATLRELAPKPPAPSQKPAEIVIQTSPGAEIYIDDQFAGRASPQGRLVVQSPKAGTHSLRVSLVGKRDYEQQVTVTAGETTNLQAALADVEKPKPNPPVETPRRAVSAPAAGTVRENPKDGLKYVWIPPGTFIMGCSPGDTECGADEKPAHQVMITKGFWMGQTEVTVAAYRKFVGSTGAQMPEAPNFNAGWSNQEMPIVNVSWNDATAFCGWAGGRLPTEAEWEYAARAGSTEARYGPIDEVAWYSNNSGQKTHEAAQKRPNAWNLFDTLGNVWEWVNDWYGENYYSASPERDPRGPDSGQFRVLRGGSWFNSPRVVRLSFRVGNYPAYRNDFNGVRCAREVE